MIGLLAMLLDVFEWAEERIVPREELEGVDPRERGHATDVSLEVALLPARGDVEDAHVALDEADGERVAVGSVEEVEGADRMRLSFHRLLEAQAHLVSGRIPSPHLVAERHCQEVSFRPVHQSQI